MDTKRFTQFGTISVILMIPLLGLSLYMIISSGFKNFVIVVPFCFVFLLLAICLLVFYRLTISIDDKYFSFKLGIGFISKKILLTDIQSCRSVKNEVLYGIGIRKIPNGWLYNVTGLKAVELTLKNKNTKLRIGTNRPDEIVAILGKLINNDEVNRPSDYKDKKVYYFAAIIIFMAVVIPFMLLISGSRENEVTITDSDFTIKGVYGLKINYSDIIKLDTISELPLIRLRTNGYAFNKTYKGNFKLKDETSAKLFVKDGIPPYIFIKTDDMNVYLNFMNHASTVDLYKTLIISCSKGKK